MDIVPKFHSKRGAGAYIELEVMQQGRTSLIGGRTDRIAIAPVRTNSGHV